MNRLRLLRLGLVWSLLFCLSAGLVMAGEYVKIGGKRVAVADIRMTTGAGGGNDSKVLNMYYTFYLDKRDLDISNYYLKRYLKSSNSYKRMAGIIQLYVNEEFRKYPCVGQNKCVKNIRLGVDSFFDFLNNHDDLRQKYLVSATSLSLFGGRYKSLGDFMVYLARDVGYAFYGISYMRRTGIVTWTLLDKMIYSIRNDGYNGGL